MNRGGNKKQHRLDCCAYERQGQEAYEALSYCLHNKVPELVPGIIAGSACKPRRLRNTHRSRTLSEMHLCIIRGTTTPLGLFRVASRSPIMRREHNIYSQNRAALYTSLLLISFQILSLARSLIQRTLKLRHACNRDNQCARVLSLQLQTPV